MKKLASLLTVSVLIGTLAGCGGGSASSTGGSSTPTGVETPSKVSVVNTK